MSRPQPTPAPAPLGPPLTDLVGDYLNSCRARGLSPRTLATSYGFALEAVFLPWCAQAGLRTLDDLDQQVLDRFTTDLNARISRRGRPLSKASVHSYVRPVRQLLTWARGLGETVAGQPQLPRLPHRERQPLSRAEISRLEAAADRARDQLVLRLFADCGLRLLEVTGLGPADLRRSGHRTHLCVRGKGDRERFVPLPPDLARRLDRFIRTRPAETPPDRLFAASRRGAQGTYAPLTRSGVAQIVHALGSRAALDRPVNPHLLRHSWMTQMIRQGMNPIQLRIIGGASEGVIAEHYTHLTADDGYDAMLRALERR